MRAYRNPIKGALRAQKEIDTFKIAENDKNHDFLVFDSASLYLVVKPVAQGQYVVSDTRCPAMYVGDCR